MYIHKTCNWDSFRTFHAPFSVSPSLLTSLFIFLLGDLTVENLINDQLVNDQHDYSDDIGDLILNNLYSLSEEASAYSSKISSLMVLTS